MDHAKRLPGWIVLALFLPLAILIGLLILPALRLVYAYRSLTIRWKLRRAWPTGQWILLSYTQSAVWAPYLENEVIPRLGDACIAIDRTQPDWKERFPVEARAIDHWGGNRSYNPLAILIPRWGMVKTVRFFEAFRAKKHGKYGPLATEVARLSSLVETYGRPER